MNLVDGTTMPFEGYGLTQEEDKAQTNVSSWLQMSIAQPNSQQYAYSRHIVWCNEGIQKKTFCPFRTQIVYNI